MTSRSSTHLKTNTVITLYTPTDTRNNVNI
ncbi:rCG41443 [Rattus norvegicus]|uniref:RCG41443 n=1 Tax=Rattus norvegicus TaxID=10116 RepID=A6IHT1_RAT|nr:rCG41443 [Rattus norvegicus]